MSQTPSLSQSKVLSSHLSRQAVIYIRQSSPKQVQMNLESQKRQYQLVEQAQSMGWLATECVVIDDDLGLSGAKSQNRPGYQRLISMLALREVGIVFGLEVSRLARNSLDWYYLLELAAVFDVLIADEDGIYDPKDFNDRLLLGLKGTISEVELHQIQTRMVRGRINKVKRGEFRFRLPVGLEWDEITGLPRLTPDTSVRHAVALVFHLFRQLRSIRSVLNYMRRQGISIPYQKFTQGLVGQIGWRGSSYDAIYAKLTNPTYAGVYCYGKFHQHTDPLTQKVCVRKVKRDDWHAFLPDHHPGYITLAEFEVNQSILKNNSNQFLQSQGAPRQGAALLSGLVFCNHCERKMRVRYSHGVGYYLCDATHRRYGEPICNRASAKRVDALVEELFLTVINRQTLELSLSYNETLRTEEALVDKVWQEKLQRLEYEADLTRRRYELVDPANRLVAATLESEWNEKLVALDTARREYEAQKPGGYQRKSTLEQMESVVTHLPQYWHSQDISPEDKKELLRCIIQQVVLENQGKVIRTQVHWHGGTTSELDVPKYLFSPPHLYHRIGQLAQEHTDTEIACLLNEQGITTVKGKSWTVRRVMDFRLSNHIPSGFTTNVTLRIPKSGYITSREAAEQLQINQTTVQKWYRLGVLDGKHDGGQSPLWIRWTGETWKRLGGTAKPDPRMVSVRSLCRTHNKRPDEILLWAKAGEHIIYRLRRGSTMRFFILPKPAENED